MQSIWASCLRAVRIWIVTLKARVLQSASLFYNVLPSLNPRKQDAIHPPAAPPPFISLGSTGMVYKLSDHIIVKKCRPERDDYLAYEQEVFQELNRHSPLSPYIIQHFYDTQDAIFLEYMPGGSLGSILEQAKIRDKIDRMKIIQVKTLQPMQDCLKWMRQLAAAAAWLEKLGFSHCDIRPDNILLSSVQNIRLADFDQAQKVGYELESLTEPYARLLGDEGGSQKGFYGTAGPRTEQFAIGTVAYALTRGHHPYETEWWGDEHGVIVKDMLQHMKFPPLGQGMLDAIIRNCWYGCYTSIAELLETLADLEQEPREVVEKPASASEIIVRRKECEVLAHSGILETLFIM